MTATNIIITNERTAQVVQGEIDALKKLIAKRKGWIDDDTNRKRSTWGAIVKDTRQMEMQLEQLNCELHELTNYKQKQEV